MYLIADIIERILDDILENGGDEYDQHSFCATSLDIYKMSLAWRLKNFGLGTTILSPYIVAISKKARIIDKIKMDTDIELMTLSIACQKIKEYDGVLILISKDNIKKYLEVVKNCGLFNTDPEKSNIVLLKHLEPETTKLKLTPQALAMLTDGVDVRGGKLRPWDEREE